jgi:hypothetical protein
MAGSIIINEGTIWSVGSQAFYPIVERVRAAFPAGCERLAEAIVAPLEQGFSFIALDELSAQEFCCIVALVDAQYSFCVNSNVRCGLPEEFYDTIMACWRELLTLLKADPRYKATASDS